MTPGAGQDGVGNAELVDDEEKEGEDESVIVDTLVVTGTGCPQVDGA